MHKCGLCGGSVMALVGTKDDRSVVRCFDCKLLQTFDPPADYLKLYTEGDTYHKDREQQPPYYERFDHDLAVGRQRIHTWWGKTRWLDVGSSNGGFLAAAKSYGLAVEGLELNANIAAWSAERSGCPVHTSWATAGEYDVVSYHDVIEHCPDPRAELLKAREHLSTGGLLIVDTPDISYWQDPMTSHHMKPREHLYFFTPPLLEELVNQAGFEVTHSEAPIPGKIVLYARKVDRAFAVAA